MKNEFTHQFKQVDTPIRANKLFKEEMNSVFCFGWQQGLCDIFGNLFFGFLYLDGMAYTKSCGE